ncbi:MAG: tetratricopeptide repeat protein [Gammaproteobacteria bacterium]|nr:tetratricopeptide repeat protein [Gammaproteobacteria bacterium]
MSDHIAEQEQAESLKRWWKENGTVVIVGLVVGLAIVVGYRLWLDYTYGKAEAASAEYQQLMVELDQQTYDRVYDRGGRIISQYESTPYAQLASLAMAKAYVAQDDLAGAATQLRRVLQNADSEAMQHVARLRLARVLLSQGSTSEALSLIETVDGATFTSVYEELKGDIQLAQQQPALARTSYTKALALLGAGRDRSLLQMKLDNVGPSN